MNPTSELLLARSLNTVLVNAGYRLTYARRIIIENFVRSGGHITADELVERIHREAERIGRMTVYRTLELLTDLGLARPIFQGTGAAHYILMSEGDHHHMICNRCNAAIEFDDCSAGAFMDDLASKHGFSVQSHLFEIHGICRDCHG